MVSRGFFKWSQKLGLQPPIQQGHNILPGPNVVPALVLELILHKTPNCGNKNT
jgi:hypothetical protein